MIGDSLTSCGAITQTLLNHAASDVMKVKLIGTRGYGMNKHEGRGGWGISSYVAGGRKYYKFTVSGIKEEPDINATEYRCHTAIFKVQEVDRSSGDGTLVCSLESQTVPAFHTEKMLTKTAGNGDVSIAFSTESPFFKNPFWFDDTVNFWKYLAANSLATPDWVFIQLGTNDCCGITSDAKVADKCEKAFAQLGTLIASIKAVNSTVEVGLMFVPPPSHSQDSFGTNYGCGLNRARVKRNFTIFYDLE